MVERERCGDDKDGDAPANMNTDAEGKKEAHYNAHELLRRPLSELIFASVLLCEFVLTRP